MKKRVWGVGVAFALSGTAILAKEVELTNHEGKEILVELLSASKSEVSVKLLKTGKTIFLPLKDLSADSKTIIREWMESGRAKSEDFEVTAILRKRIDRGNSKGKKVQPTKISVSGDVSITNVHDSLASTSSKVHTILFGRSVAKTGLYYVFDTKATKVGTLEPGESKEVKLRALKTTYLDDKKKSYGAKYSGYVVIITNEAGDVVGGKSVPSNIFLNYKDQLKGLQKDAFYDRDWQRVAFKDKHPKNKKK